MCGIIAYLGPHQACPDVLTALARLQYLGQHSAGIAMLGEQGIEVRRAIGPCAQLIALLDHQPLAGSCAIAHTRGATIGGATLENCHPHRSADGRIAVVHSGDVANHAALHRELAEQGAVFAGNSDSEVIPHLLAANYARGSSVADALAAVRAACARLQGGNAIAVLFADHPGRIFAARQGSPLFIGRSAVPPSAAVRPPGREAGGKVGPPRHWWLSSDVFALRGFADEVCAVEDGQVLELNGTAVSLTTPTGVVAPALYRKRRLVAALTAMRLLARRIRQALWPGRSAPPRAWSPAR